MLSVHRQALIRAQAFASDNEKRKAAKITAPENPHQIITNYIFCFGMMSIHQTTVTFHSFTG
jgi:hypothetical protein